MRENYALGQSFSKREGRRSQLQVIYILKTELSRLITRLGVGSEEKTGIKYHSWFLARATEGMIVMCTKMGKQQMEMECTKLS